MNQPAAVVIRYWGLGAVILCIIAGILRVTNLTADPPTPVPADGAFYTDQGWYNHNVLKKYNTGTWFLDVDRSEMSHTALFGFIQYAAFKTCGIHYWVAKLQPLLFSLGTIVAAFLFITYAVGPLPGLASLGLMSINYQHIIYSNLALVEPTVTFFLVLSFVFWYLSRTRSVWYAVAGGGALFLAILSKTHAAHFAFFLLLAIGFECAVFVKKPERVRLLWRGVLLLTALFVCYTFWYIWWIEPNRVYWSSFGHYIKRLPAGISTNHIYFAKRHFQAFLDSIYYGAVRTPILFALCTTALAVFGACVIRGKREFLREHYVFCLCALWIVADLLFFVAARVARPRYQMMLIVPFIYSAVWLGFNGKNLIQSAFLKKADLWACIAPVAMVLLWKATQSKNADPRLYIAAITFIVMAMYAVICFKAEWLLQKRMIISLLCVHVALQLGPWMWWTMHKTYSIRETGAEVRNILKKNNLKQEYVLGPLAATFALEGGFNTISGQGFPGQVDNEKRFAEIVRRYHPRYVLHNARNITSYRKEYFPQPTQWDLMGTYTYAVRSSFTTPLPEDQTLYLYRLTYPGQGNAAAAPK